MRRLLLSLLLCVLPASAQTFTFPTTQNIGASNFTGGIINAASLTNAGIYQAPSQAGTTNATTATSLAILFKYPMPNTNFTTSVTANGVALPGLFVTAKTVSGFTVNMTLFTGLLDWSATGHTQ